MEKAESNSSAGEEKERRAEEGDGKGSETLVNPGSRPRLRVPVPERMTCSSSSSWEMGVLGHSPGPMTLARSCFQSDAYADANGDSDFRSFSQLLATAISSPCANSSKASASASASASVGVNKPAPLPPVSIPNTQSTGFFTLSPGLSPSVLLESPGFLPLNQQSLGMTVSHQQALAQVQAQAQGQSSSFTSTMPPPSDKNAALPIEYSAGLDHSSLETNYQTEKTNNSGDSQFAFQTGESSQRPSASSVTVADRPTDDGYNWRKYGQKPVKGSLYPRSYYRCTHPSCPVKKKVERSLDGQVTEIVYRGEHCHSKRQSSRRPVPHDANHGSPDWKPDYAEPVSEMDSTVMDPSISVRDVSGSSEEDDLEDDGNGGENGSDAKRPKTWTEDGDSASTAASFPHRTVKEPRIIVQTTSDVDILDDGYRWRKYGQKVVKGNPNPRYLFFGFCFILLDKKLQ
eukprot:TRINITY_DN3952_c0_g1_i1.p1 TRINITY_DN3952_c0_g1~~TRINITY_DN3952_c0_g1_i1.p1  ORF type:complete len:458 (+),score=59.28 TRINITY_DN3952_c0_g1_i1:502-1875(+)